jgi:hypothetical protein
MRIEQFPVVTASARGAAGIGSFQQSATHSRTFPSMSCSPKAFAGKLPIGAVIDWDAWLPQPSQFASFAPRCAS